MFQYTIYFMERKVFFQGFKPGVPCGLHFVSVGADCLNGFHHIVECFGRERLLTVAESVCGIVVYLPRLPRCTSA